MSNSMKKRLKAFKKITKKYIEEVCVKSGVEPTCIDTDEFMVFDGEQGKKAVRISFNPYFMNFYGRIEEDYYPTVDDADIIYDSDRPSFPFFGANNNPKPAPIPAPIKNFPNPPFLLIIIVLLFFLTTK